MKLLANCLLLFLIPVSFCYSQNVKGMYKDTTLFKIDRDIVYKTDDLKKRLWKIDDINLTSEILQKLINNKKLKAKFNGSEKNIDSLQILNLWENVHDGDVEIICRSRQYDNQVEHMEFLVDGNPAFSPIDDWLNIRDALSVTTYDIVKLKNYPYSDLSKRDYVNTEDNFNLILSALHSELLISTLELANNKGNITAYYELGNDNINLPSWHKGSINLGLKYKLVPHRGISNNNFERFGVAIGWDGPMNFSVEDNFNLGFMQNMFSKRLLYSTSDNLFLGISYSPQKNDPEPFKWMAIDGSDGNFVQLNAEASMPIFENKRDLPLIMDKFNSVRGYFSFKGRVCNLWDFFNIGASFSYFQLYSFSEKSGVNDPILLGSNKHYLFSIEPAISREDSPISYNISPQINFDIVNGQKFFVLKSQLMFFGVVGIEFNYFESINKKIRSSWQYDNYIVVSPIIRINY
jgi:hypothetical protein